MENTQANIKINVKIHKKPIQPIQKTSDLEPSLRLCKAVVLCM